MSSTNRDELLEQLNQAGQRLGNQTVLFTHAIAGHIGLSATEFECLDFLQACGAVPAGRLAELTGLTTGAVTGLIDRLEHAGFVRRLSDPADRRKVLVEAVENEAIVRRIRELYQPVQAGFLQLTSAYSNEEIALITRYIHESLVMIDIVIEQMNTPKAE